MKENASAPLQGHSPNGVRREVGLAVLKGRESDRLSSIAHSFNKHLASAPGGRALPGIHEVFSKGLKKKKRTGRQDRW